MASLIWYLGLLFAWATYNDLDKIYLVYNNEQLDNYSEILNLLKQLSQKITTGMFPTAVPHLNLHVNFKRTLFVLLYPDRSTRNFFKVMINRISQTTLKSQWLLLSAENISYDKFFDGINIPFFCEFYVINKTDEHLNLTEVYRISPVSKLLKINYGSWSPLTGLSVFVVGKPYKRRTNLRQTSIQVSVVNQHPTVVLNQDGFPVSGIIVKVWKELASICNFTSIYTNKKLPTNETIITSEDLIKSVSEGNNTVGLKAMSVSFERMELIDFGGVMIRTSEVIVVRKTSEEIKWDGFFEPFSGEVWLTIVGIVILGVIMIAVIKTLVQYKQPTTSKENETIKACLDLFGAYCQQGCDTPPNSVPARIVYVSIYTSSVVMLAAYSAALISSLAVDSTKKPFNSLKEMLEDGTYTLGMVYKSYEHSLFNNPNYELYWKIHKKLMVPEFQLPRHELEGLNNVCHKRNYAFILKEYNVEYFDRLDCEIQTINIGVPVSQSFILKKKFVYAGLFKYLIMNMRENGILHRIRDKKPLSNFNHNATIKVDVKNILPIVVLLIFGYLLSLVVMLIELYWTRRNRRNVKSNMKQLLNFKNLKSASKPNKANFNKFLE